MDAAAPMLAIARERRPDADLRVGDTQELPFGDATFDVVTACNACSVPPSRRRQRRIWAG